MNRPLELLTEELLRFLYHEENLSQWQIARMFGVTQGAIFYWMNKFRIKARSHDDALLQLGKSGRFTGEKNPRWNGGRHISYSGHVMVRLAGHPLTDNRGYVREHRLIWWEANGPIPKGCDIHHKNGDKTDNRIENLELLTHKQHCAVIPRYRARIAELERQLQEMKNERSGSVS